jgi:hypothetical protein
MRFPWMYLKSCLAKVLNGLSSKCIRTGLKSADLPEVGYWPILVWQPGKVAIADPPPQSFFTVLFVA